MSVDNQPTVLFTHKLLQQLYSYGSRLRFHSARLQLPCVGLQVVQLQQQLHKKPQVRGLVR